MTTEAIRTSWYARHHDAKPAQTDDSGVQHWATRGANFVVVVSRVSPGAVLSRQTQDDEYLVLLPEGVAAQFDAGAQTERAEGDTLVIVPPGASRVTVQDAGFVYRIFTNRARDWLALADNATAYADGAPQVAPLSDWPEPVGGYRLRLYPLARYIRPGVFGRLFRTQGLMVNVFEPQREPRDPRKMTPHSHTDFEQGSLAVQGRYVHHLRYPWVPDMTTWREDEHGEVGSPSLIVIPPQVVHTTQSIGTATTQLVDIFAPPREDFSLMPDLVCNADEYPLPERLREAAAAKAKA